MLGVSLATGLYIYGHMPVSLVAWTFAFALVILAFGRVKVSSGFASMLRGGNEQELMWFPLMTLTLLVSTILRMWASILYGTIAFFQGSFSGFWGMRDEYFQFFLAVLLFCVVMYTARRYHHSHMNHHDDSSDEGGDILGFKVETS